MLPKYKNHAAGQPSDWAQAPIPGQPKRWAIHTGQHSVANLADLAEERAQSSYNKKRAPLSQVKSPSRENLVPTNIGTANDDKASIITLDKLKKFNEIYGYEGGPAVEEAEELQDKVEEIEPVK